MSLLYIATAAHELPLPSLPSGRTTLILAYRVPLASQSLSRHTGCRCRLHRLTGETGALSIQSAIHPIRARIT